MKKSSARLSLIACLLIVCALHFLSQPTLSLSNSTTINVVFEFEKTLELSVSDPEMYIMNLLPGTTDNTNEIYVNVATNSETGFIMDAAVGERLRPSTRIPNILDNETYFQSVGLNNTVTTIPAGRWGYSIDHGATYSGLPDYRDVHPSDIFIESNTAANMSLPFLVGATAADDQARGIYYTPITFRAVTRPTVPTIDTILYMQEMDETIYASMKTEKQYQLMDKRDGKMYFISKLKDGNIWMTQNLDFDLYDGITLTPDTSDVLTEKTMDLTAPGTNYYGGSDHYYYYDNYMYDQGDYYCPNGWCHDTNDLSPLDMLEPTDKENHWALGNRYSFSAATANYWEQCPKYQIDSAEYNACQNRYSNQYSGKNSETSICPAGWTLPAAYKGENPSLYDLGVAIGFPTDYSSYSNNYPIFDSPIYLVGNGYVYANESSPLYFNGLNQGANYAYYWTSTNAGSYSSYTLYSYIYTTSKTNSTTGTTTYYAYGGYLSSSANSYSMYYLLTLRCVARAPQYTVEYYMNDGISRTPYDTWKSKMAWSGNNTVKPKAPSRTGYKFLGWGTSPKTVEARYYDGVTIKLDSYNTKLYAVWEPIDEDDMMEGVYSFEAVFRRAGKTPVDGYYNMQDLSAEMCQEVEVGERTLLRDSRDGKVYEVAKDNISPDGKYGTCWMHNDLRLGSRTEAYTLTPEDSDVTNEYTIPAIGDYSYNYSTFGTDFIADVDDHEDVNGKTMGYIYNYNVATAGYQGAHSSSSDWQASESSICPKNWTLPRNYDRDAINSEKQIWDNIEPTNYSETYYDNGYNGKLQNIKENFLNTVTLANWNTNYGSDRDPYREIRASKDFIGTTFYGTIRQSSSIQYSSWNQNRFTTYVRCMVPVDISLTTTTIYYNFNYSGPYSSSSTQQRVSTLSSDPMFYVEIKPTTTVKRPGWYLIGWSERSGATVPDYYVGDIMEMPITKTSINLYAVWSRIVNINIVSFDDAFEAAGKTKHGDYYAMQDMSPEICDAVSDAQQGRLIDLRDDKVYWVGRFTSVYDSTHEGECWMTQNLDFELSTEETGTRLYPATSDVEEEMVVRSDNRDSDACYLGYVSASDYYLPNGGIQGYGNGQRSILASVSDLEKDDERWHYHLGSYYGWASATITNDIASIDQRYQYMDRNVSICPQGWKLPSYNYNNYTARSFNAFSSYILYSMNSGYNNYYGADPFYPTFGGFIPPTNDDFDTVIDRNYLGNLGYYASYQTPNTSTSDRASYYWYYYRSSTYTGYSDTDLKNLYSTSYGNNYMYVYYLHNVRCVAR